MEQLTQLIFYVGLLTLGVNVITEVLKKILVLKDGSHAGELICFVESLVLTLFAVVGYCLTNAINITASIIIGGIFGAFFVCYSAMYGYDKLKELVGKYVE